MAVAGVVVGVLLLSAVVAGVVVGIVVLVFACPGTQ